MAWEDFFVASAKVGWQQSDVNDWFEVVMIEGVTWACPGILPEEFQQEWENGVRQGLQFKPVP